VESAQKTTKRSRGTIRKHRAGYQVRVSAGTDPVTGERLRLQGTAPTVKEAEKLRTKLLGEADTFRASRTNASLGYLLDRWLPQHDIDENTRKSYESLIRLYLRPALGDLPLTTLVRKSTETSSSSTASCAAAGSAARTMSSSANSSPCPRPTSAPISRSVTHRP
jgi:hypothetical protein